MTKKSTLVGKWRVVSSPDFDDDYLQEEGEPFITLQQSGDRIEGEYSVGLQSGDIDGRLRSSGEVIFSFAGMDEMDEVNGAGAIICDGETLSFTLMYHQGDDFTFECERAAATGRSKKRK